jgi:hypothetical protein
VINGEHIRNCWGPRPGGEFADFDVDEAEPG